MQDHLAYIDVFLVPASGVLYLWYGGNSLGGCRITSIHFPVFFRMRDTLSNAEHHKSCPDSSLTAQPTSDVPTRTKPSPALIMETLEPRILLSGTWVDADTLDPLEGATALDPYII